MVTLALVSVVLVSADVPERVVVLPARRDGTASYVPPIFDEYLLSGVQKLPGVRAVGQGDIEALLNLEKQRDLLGCDDVTCFAEIGGALDCDALLVVHIARVAATWAVSAKVISLRETVAQSRVTKSISGGVEALLAAADDIARDALRPRPTFEPSGPAVSEVSEETSPSDRADEPRERQPTHRVVPFGLLAVGKLEGSDSRSKLNHGFVATGIQYHIGLSNVFALRTKLGASSVLSVWGLFASVGVEAAWRILPYRVPLATSVLESFVALDAAGHLGGATHVMGTASAGFRIVWVTFAVTGGVRSDVEREGPAGTQRVGSTFVGGEIGMRVAL